MKAERWQRVEQLYHSTLEKEVSERSSFLAEACAGDEGLRREVKLLRDHLHHNFLLFSCMSGSESGTELK